MQVVLAFTFLPHHFIYSQKQPLSLFLILCRNQDERILVRWGERKMANLLETSIFFSSADKLLSYPPSNPQTLLLPFSAFINGGRRRRKTSSITFATDTVSTTTSKLIKFSSFLLSYQKVLSFRFQFKTSVDLDKWVLSYYRRFLMKTKMVF